MIIGRKRIGLFWFTNDLRLHDNPALMCAGTLVDQLVCVYVSDLPWQSTSRYILPGPSAHVETFLEQSINDLALQLDKLGQHLIVANQATVSCITNVIEQTSVTDVFRSENAGWYENRLWEVLQKNHPDKCFHSIDSHTLFDRSQLPFLVHDLPASFTQFKKAVSGCPISEPIATITSLPPLPRCINRQSKPSQIPPGNTLFKGGERAGLINLKAYFSGDRPSFYKEVRNSIDGWDNSCKLSPWLANGSLSAREVVATLLEYEKTRIANESTYWIFFELLWREFFQWYAHKYGQRLFSLAGIKQYKPLTSFYSERFQKWVNGATQYPIVNACMNELKATGYLSNRGRQIVASCLVNELSIDWRYGAAYFEQTLIDYDVASNWGNWQYLAGVGADVRSKRHFNLAKQTQQFDPDGRYVDLWNGNTNLQPLDSSDIADWPII